MYQVPRNFNLMELQLKALMPHHFHRLHQRCLISPIPFIHSHSTYCYNSRTFDNEKLFYHRFFRSVRHVPCECVCVCVSGCVRTLNINISERDFFSSLSIKYLTTQKLFNDIYSAEIHSLNGDLFHMQSISIIETEKKILIMIITTYNCQLGSCRWTALNDACVIMAFPIWKIKSIIDSNWNRISMCLDLNSNAITRMRGK